MPLLGIIKRMQVVSQGSSPRFDSVNIAFVVVLVLNLHVHFRYRFLLQIDIGEERFQSLNCSRVIDRSHDRARIDRFAVCKFLEIFTFCNTAAKIFFLLTAHNGLITRELWMNYEFWFEVRKWQVVISYNLLDVWSTYNYVHTVVAKDKPRLKKKKNFLREIHRPGVAFRARWGSIRKFNWLLKRM